ncbi:MAG: heme lyase CcmF/NrfE family subunit [Thermoleophilia bacterium]
MIAGRALLIIALGVCVYGIAAAVLGARRGREDLVASARRATYAVAVLAAGAMLVLELAYLRDDFSYALVASNSSTTTPLFYKATSMWSSQAGSLLLWLVILSALAALAVRVGRRRFAALVPYAIAVLLAVAAFFAALLVLAASPFEASTGTVVEGNGLMPLLRYPMMAFHPVALYTGYAGFAVPFAFAISALITRRLDATWLVAVRHFTLFAWAALALGLVLGSRWSYAELGWGGYWGWDPVENAALLPFLTGTALLHSSMIQEKRGMLKVWNVSLVIATFVLSLTGTFLVRSGILDSIHAFGASTLGVPFVIFIATVVIGSSALVIARLRDLRSEHRLDALASRESVFLLNNLVLVALAFVVFWGTFWPLISELMTGQRGTLGPPWFERFVPPLGIVLVLLTGIGPLLAWRQQSVAGMWHSFMWPTLATVATIPALLVFTDVPAQPAAFAAIVCIAFALAALVQEFWRGTNARRDATGQSRARALMGLIARNRRRYGGYIVHVGFAVLLLGVAVSSSFDAGRDVRLRPGQSVRVGGFDFNYDRPTSRLANEKITLGADVSVTRDGRPVARLYPARELYPSQDVRSLGAIGRFIEGEQTSEIGLRQSFRTDLWVAMRPDLALLEQPTKTANARFASSPPEVQGVIIAALVQRYVNVAPPVTFRIIVRTGVTWIWLGAIVLGFGALIALWPSPSGRTGRRVQRRTRRTIIETALHARHVNGAGTSSSPKSGLARERVTHADLAHPPQRASDQ